MFAQSKIKSSRKLCIHTHLLSVLFIYRAYALVGRTRLAAILLSIFAIVSQQCSLIPSHVWLMLRVNMKIVFATGFTLFALLSVHLSGYIFFG